MKTRTYGWVQNPSSFSNLKKVVKIFDKNSDHYIDMRNNLLTSVYFTDVRDKLQDKLNKGETIFSYTELVGTSRNSSGKSPKKRSDAVADALIKIVSCLKDLNVQEKLGLIIGQQMAFYVGLLV